jgi:hypothetical protein
MDTQNVAAVEGTEVKKTRTKKEPKAPKPKIKLTVQQLTADLEAGLDRAGIAAKYGIPKAEVIRLFKHPKLKGLKTKVASNVELVDEEETTVNGSDVSATSTETPAPVAEQPVMEGQATLKEGGIW